MPSKYISMSDSFNFKISPGIEDLKPYLTGKAKSTLERELKIFNSIKLASNENPLGMSSLAVKAIKGEISDLSRYPDGNAYSLREKIMERHSVNANQITIGNGSNDVLDMIAKVFLYPMRESIFSQHSFAVYYLSSMSAGATLKIAKAKEYGNDLDEMLRLVNKNTGVIWIANPNNPTGTWLTKAALFDFIKKIPKDVVVVVDEAYFEYVLEDEYPDSSLWVNDFPNLIVTRSFSKAFGLASLRIGYGLSSPKITDLLNRVRQPFNCNSFAQAAATASLGDHEFIEKSVILNKNGLLQLTDGFKKLGLEFIPSVGNFLTIKIGEKVNEINDGLQKEGIITRPVDNYGLKGFLRVSVGLQEENAKFLRSLEKVL